jgi:metal-sulfur cluster biosynthetic enzyme
MWEKLGVTKRTDPVGTPLSGACSVTMAVRVTGCPLTEGFTEEASSVVVATGLAQACPAYR